MTHILSINVKTADRFRARLKNADGDELVDYTGYVPSFMPGQHYGDYVQLDIDMETGLIMNWTPVADETIAEWVEKNGSTPDDEDC